jgi:hypothetical protein
MTHEPSTDYDPVLLGDESSPYIFTALGEDTYRLTDAKRCIELLARRLHYERYELHGELAVYCGLATARVVDEGLLLAGSFNFSSVRVRQERAKMCRERRRPTATSTGTVCSRNCVIASSRPPVPAHRRSISERSRALAPTASLT